MAELKLIVFDLDGTLIDSRVDLANSVNAALGQIGRAPLPEAVIAGYVGDGAEMLIRRTLGDPQGGGHDEATVAEAMHCFLAYYREHKLDHTYVYAGAMEALTAISAAHPELLMAVLTNKPVRPSRDICAHFGLDRFFFQNYGGNSFAMKKPDPLGLRTLMAEASLLRGDEIDPVEVLMVGDSDVDVATARKAGARCLGCGFGLAPAALAAAMPDAMVALPAEWPDAIAAMMR